MAIGKMFSYKGSKQAKNDRYIKSTLPTFFITISFIMDNAAIKYFNIAFR